MAMLIAKISKFFSREPKESLTVRLYKAALVLKCHDYFVEHNADPLRKDIEEMCNHLDKMGSHKLKLFIKSSLDSQVEELFEKVESNADRYFAYHERSKDTADIMSEISGHCPYLSDGSVDARGRGVFLKGSVGAGSIVAIFPGIVHLREYTGQKNYIEDNLLPDDNFFLMRRDDNVIIDARPKTLATNPIPYNPFALGHMLNHGSSKETGKGPAKSNVLQVNYDFPNDTMFERLRFPKQLRPFIPNIYAKEPSLMTSDRSAMMRTVVFISTRPIDCGSELLVDYKLNGTPNFPLPDWYPREDELDPTEELMPTKSDQGDTHSKGNELFDKHFS